MTCNKKIFYKFAVFQMVLQVKVFMLLVIFDSKNIHDISLTVILNIPKKV